MMVYVKQSCKLVEGNESITLLNGDIKNIDERWAKNELFKSMNKDGLIIVNFEGNDKNAIKQIESSDKKQEQKNEEQAMKAELAQAKKEAVERATQTAQDNGLDETSKKKLIAEEVKKAEEEVKAKYTSNK